MRGEVELTGPRDAVQSAGAKVVLVAPSKGTIQAFNHLDKGSTFQAEVAVADARAEDYDGLVLPGGVANPDQLRQDEDALRFVKGALRDGKAGCRDLPRGLDARRSGLSVSAPIWWLHPWSTGAR